MLIKVENTSNPNICNFYPEVEIAKKGKAEFSDAKSLRKSPLAEAIFDIGEIEQIIIAGDMVSVTKKQAADWADLNPQIMALILDFAATGQLTTLEADNDQPEASVLQKALSLIDARIRPALQKDGGDIVIRDFKDGILLVQLTGKCASCPYAVQTLKNGVEKVLKNYIPEIISVRPVAKEVL